MSKRILQTLCLSVLIHVMLVTSSVGSEVNSEEKLLTPLEASGFAELSSHGDMMVYLEKVDRLSDRIALEVIDKSVEGRDIPLVMMTDDKRFGSRRSEKPIVYIFAQQHGNEPSGKEAALILIRELAVGSLQDLLEDMDVLVVPMVNPDGGEKGQRRNANDKDLNRNHAILSEPEVTAVHRVFLEWMPEVTLDVHEYNAISRQWMSHGFIKDAEEMLDRVSNLNIASSIRDFSNDIFIPEVGRIIREDGFTFYRYIVGAPFENQRVRHSTTDINDGRQSLGIYNTLSFIFEGKRYGDLINKIERRTKGQVSALTAFLRTVARYRKNILTIVHSTRNEILHASGQKNCYIQMDYYPDPDQPKLKLPVFDLYSWRHTEKELERYEPIVRIKKSIEKPRAYIFSQKETKLVDLFLKHRIEMFHFNTDTDLEVETYTILHVTSCMEEDKATEYVDVRTESMNKKMKAGDVVVFLKQSASNLIPLLLEPQSSYSICTERSGREYRFSEYLEEGKEYPVFRLMSPIPLNVKKLETNEE